MSEKGKDMIRERVCEPKERGVGLGKVRECGEPEVGKSCLNMG